MLYNHEPSIECSADSVAVVFKTLKPFDGRVYAKGFVDQIGCVGSGMGNQVPTLNLTFSDCGVQRTRQLSPPGITVSTTIVISFHKVFITKVDRAYRISCFYMEAAKSVTAMLDV
uniref:ZP domain-containing protein n=1 Tax=Romanomermis culicivorax TaxID=13658 RepID=A0A915IEQ6_ROMCU